MLMPHQAGVPIDQNASHQGYEDVWRVANDRYKSDCGTRDSSGHLRFLKQCEVKPSEAVDRDAGDQDIGKYDPNSTGYRCGQCKKQVGDQQ